jgi:hypothetical protein
MIGDWERVWAVFDYWDGPRRGVADFGGAPHAYERYHDGEDVPDWDPFYRLQRIDDATLALVVEQWAIWVRWATAFHAGAETIETHPALPHERARNDELARMIGDRLTVAMDAPSARAEFRGDVISGASEVRWEPIAS